MTALEPGEAGWGRLANSRKWHFIVPESSLSGHKGPSQATLCGARVLFRAQDAPPLENDADDHEDNCATCKRKVSRWRERNDYPEDGEP